MIEDVRDSKAYRLFVKMVDEINSNFALDIEKIWTSPELSEWQYQQIRQLDIDRICKINATCLEMKRLIDSCYIIGIIYEDN